MYIYKEFNLQPKQYINDIAHEMDLHNGINLLIADVGTGKSYYFSKLTNTYFSAPLVSIVSSVDGTDVQTWNALVSRVHGAVDKTVFNNKTLVIDEIHGLYADYSYKASVIRELVAVFPYFKSVVLMSGTVKQEYLNSMPIDRVYRVIKPSQATKEVIRFNYKQQGKAVLESLIMQNKNCRATKRKTIALVNDIKLCKRIAQSYGDKALVVSSEVKETPEVQAFFQSKMMGDYELIIGTDSIREGLSIEDDLDEVDIFIYGHTDPDGIEQFTNRFRNVRYTKSLHYITPVRDSKTLKDFDIEVYTDDAERLATAITEAYRAFRDDTFREHFRTQYNQDIKGSHIRYSKESDCFIVDKLSIDASYSEYRGKQCEYDPVLWEMRMKEYAFTVQNTVFIDGDLALSKEISEDISAIKKVQEKEREEVLRSLIESYRTGTFEHTGKLEEYDALRDSIDKLRKVGLKEEQIQLVVNGVIEDKTFISKVWADYNYIDEQSNIRNMILEYIAIECPDDELTKFDLHVICSMIIRKVQKELFNDCQQTMMKNKLWKTQCEYKGWELVVKDNCQLKVINRYITLSNGERKRTSTLPENSIYRNFLEWKKLDRYYSYKVKYTNLTGFSIDKSAAIGAVMLKEVTDSIQIKHKLMAIRGLAA